MKKIYRTIVYFVYAIKARSLSNPIPQSSVFDEKKENPFLRRISGWLAYGYRRVANFREKTRVWENSLDNEKHEHRILKEIIKFNKRVLSYLLIAIILGWLIDSLYWRLQPKIKNIHFIAHNFRTISSSSLQEGLVIYVGAVSALLGLIFALYAVGFQLSTEKYSDRVTAYMNEERVSTYFFSLLVFTDLFAVVTFLKLHFVRQEPVGSFILVSILVAFCFLGILIFKSHYIESMKPVNVFRRLWQQSIDIFSRVTSAKRYRKKSWSIVQGSRIQARRCLNIFGSLYRDLIRSGKLDDASYAPIILGKLLRDYLENKRFINNDYGWWSEQRFEQPTGNTASEYSIKAAYELQGRGTYFSTTQDTEWFENLAFSLLNEIRNSALEKKDSKLLYRASDGYKQLLVGDREKKPNGDPIDILGAWQYQEFYTVNSALPEFLKLVDGIDFTDELVADSVVNDYFAIVVAIADRWDDSLVIEHAKKFYEGDQLNTRKGFAGDRKVPAEAMRILRDYWGRLEVEQRLEGRLITPQDNLLSSLQDDLKKNLDEQINKTLSVVFSHSSELIKRLIQNSSYEYAGQFIKMQMTWITRLFHEGQGQIAENFASFISDNSQYILLLPKDVVDKLDLLDTGENGLFVALIEERKKLAEAYSKVVVLTRLVIMLNTTVPEESAKYQRLTVIWGGAIYLLAELRQDYSSLLQYVELLDALYPNGSLPKIVEIVKDYRPQSLIGWEVNRYNRWFQSIAQKLRNELVEEPYQERGAMGFSTHFVHPSSFISSLTEWEFDFQDRTIEGFADWVRSWDMQRKSVQISALIYTLKNYIELKESEKKIQIASLIHLLKKRLDQQNG